MEVSKAVLKKLAQGTEINDATGQTINDVALQDKVRATEIEDLGDITKIILDMNKKINFLMKTLTPEQLSEFNKG